MSHVAAATLVFLVLGPVDLTGAQSPTGGIAGVVTDSSGAVLTKVQVIVTNRDTGQSRIVTTSTAGAYNASALPPGEYVVTVEVPAFKRVERAATIAAGTTTTVDLALAVGEMRDTVTVTGAVPLIRRDHHQVGGVVTRDQIENLPLNGRNFLELAKLEPGVTNPVRGAFNRIFLPSLGAGLQTIPRIGFTRISVDGASTNGLSPVGTSFQVSQEVVQEFQMATVNFQLATSPTMIAALNIVTRAGTNRAHGGGFSLYRDHNLAAYPGLARDPHDPDPFFRRHQFGGAVHGPIRRGRAFYSASYERHDQRGIVSVQPSDPDLTRLAGLFPSPSLSHLFSGRVDVHFHPDHHVYARYTLDRSQSLFSGVGSQSFLPSAWSRSTTRLNQSLVAVTSVLSPGAVNEFRFSRFYQNGTQRSLAAEECPAPCFGQGAPRIVVADAGVTLGATSAQSSVGDRYHVSDRLIWQKGGHSLHVGFEWEHTTVTDTALDAGQITLWSPQAVRQRAPAIALPSAFTSVDEILALPLRNFQTGVGPSSIPQRGFRPERVIDLYRFHAGDVWRIGPRLTLNGGLGWSYEPNALNHDLNKPALLIPILGSRLTAPRVQRANFSPVLGFVWTATADGNTVIRGGASRYFDPAAGANTTNLAIERSLLSPLGTGRITIMGGQIVHEGRPLDFSLQPTSFTGAQLLAILPGKLAELLPSFNADNRDFSIRTIDFTKAGSNLSDPSNQTPYVIHFSLGVQRQLPLGFVVSADAVVRRFVHTFINGIDYNRWNSAGGPVIPACVGSQRSDVNARCSTRNIFFDTTIGRATYKGLLVRVEKRSTRRTQFLGSYALGSFGGSNGTGTGTAENTGGRVFGFNNDDWFENDGPLPTDQRHVLNLSGFVELPWRLQVAFSVSAYSRPPFTAYVAAMDFNGDGTQNDLLPGTNVNQFGRGLGEQDLERLVEQYNAQYAGRRTPTGPIAPSLTLPDAYSFDDSFFTQDVRLSRSFRFRRNGARLSLFGEVFNLFNTPNLVGYSGNLASATFGQPTGRFTQVFGSGGPRAFQLGARVSF